MALIRSSRTMRLVAHVSSSSRSTAACASTASTVAAAWDVEPEALDVLKSRVSAPVGRLLMNGETSVWLTGRPSSARTDMALGRVTTRSRPSPGTWL